MKKMKRDIQGKFAIKNDDYREVRSLRLTDNSWKGLGIAAECLGLTRADYGITVPKREFCTLRLKALSSKHLSH